MAIPTILVISPAQGETIGNLLIEITGNNFQLPPDPPATGPVPVPAPTVEVLFGGISATKVFVITGGRLLVVTPPSVEGDVDVVINNIDDMGVLIPGETVTETDGFRYLFPSLTTERALTQLTRALMQRFKQQVHPNVSLTVHTDFDSDPTDQLNFTEIADFPHIVLIGPELVENRFYSGNTNNVVNPLPAGEFGIARESRTYDVGYEVLVLSDSTIELINLIHVLEEFFHLNKFFLFQRTPPNPECPDGESLELDIQPGEHFRWDSEPNNSNVRQGKGGFLIRGFDILGPVVEKGAVLGESQINGETGNEDPILEEIDQTGETFLVGPSPGGC